MNEIVKIIEAGKATLVGEGEWVKNSAYRVYSHNDKFYSIIVNDQQACWLMDNTLTEIPETEISHYI